MYPFYLILPLKTMVGWRGVRECLKIAEIRGGKAVGPIRKDGKAYFVSEGWHGWVEMSHEANILKKLAYSMEQMMK